MRNDEESSVVPFSEEFTLLLDNQDLIGLGLQGVRAVVGSWTWHLQWRVNRVLWRPEAVEITLHEHATLSGHQGTFNLILFLRLLLKGVYFRIIDAFDEFDNLLQLHWLARTDHAFTVQFGLPALLN